MFVKNTRHCGARHYAAIDTLSRIVTSSAEMTAGISISTAILQSSSTGASDNRGCGPDEWTEALERHISRALLETIRLREELVLRMGRVPWCNSFGNDTRKRGAS